MRFLSGGESHGKALAGIIEGLPAGLHIDCAEIDRELKRRQSGYGRGGRMKIESDRAEILSGVRGGLTLGSPLAFVIENRDFAAWKGVMGEGEIEAGKRAVTAVRPGHADLPGSLKYGFDDARNVLERASARETATRVAAGAIAKQLLSAVGVKIGSHVLAIGGVRAPEKRYSADRLIAASDESEVRCMDGAASKGMIAAIDEAKRAGDTLGGIVEVVVSGLPAGVGSYVHYDRKLDYALMGAVGGVQSVKGVEIGLGFAAANEAGSRVHDEIFFEGGKYRRKTNNAGGIEGGVSNGEDIIIRAALKPIPTVMKGLSTVDIRTKKAVRSEPERSDVCAVPAGGVVLEAVVAFTVADMLLCATGGDRMADVIRRTEEMRNYGI